MVKAPLFSIIIPVYKAERYIHECVDSVLQQDFTDYEIILVDNASPDGCPVICDEFADRHEQVKCCHLPENIKPSGARNTGLREACGEYLLFLDSDDLFAQGNLKSIADRLKKSPETDVMVLTNVVFTNEKDNNRVWKKYQPSEERFEGKSGESFLTQLIEDNLTDLHVGEKLVRREYVMQQRISFSSVHYGDDLFWTFDVFSKTENYAVCQAEHYLQRWNPYSTTNAPTYLERALWDIIDFLTLWAEHYRSSDSYGRDFFLTHLSRQYIVFMAQLMYISKEEKKKTSRQRNALIFVALRRR